MEEADSSFPAERPLPMNVVRGVYVEIDTGNVLTYVRPFAAVVIIFIGTVTLCTMPGDNPNGLLLRNIIPFVALIAALLLEKLPSINNIIDVITRHAVCIWIFHVVYSLVFGGYGRDNTNDLVLDTMASFTCSSVAIAGSFLLEWTYDKFSSVVHRYNMQQLSVFFMMAMILFPHNRAIIRFNHVLDFALRSTLFVAFVAGDLISALILHDRVEAYSFFIGKWWIFYVHPWLLPILILNVIKIGMRRTELAVARARMDSGDLEQMRDSSSVDAEEEQIALVVSHSASANEQRYIFNRPRRQHGGGLLTRKWEDRKQIRGPPREGEVDVSRLVELSEGASVGSKSV